MGVSTDEKGDVGITDDIENDSDLWFDGALVQLCGVVAAPVKSVLGFDVFEDGFFTVKKDEFDILRPFVFGGKDAGHFDKDSGGGAAVVCAQEFEFGKEFGVEVGAEQERSRGIPVGLGVGRVAGEEVGEFLRADGGDAGEGLAFGLPAQLGEFGFEILKALLVSFGADGPGAEGGQGLDVGEGVFPGKFSDSFFGNGARDGGSGNWLGFVFFLLATSDEEDESNDSGESGFDHGLSLGRAREGSRFSRGHRCHNIRFQFFPSSRHDEPRSGWRSDRGGDSESR